MRYFTVNTADDSEQWAPVSDLMAALMLIFMFIAIIYIRTVVAEEDTYREECSKIYQVLENKFGDDFAEWEVELLEDLTIRFRNPDVLFEVGKADIRPKFDLILRDFFPRYMDAVVPYRDDIREIRIEGHTSREFGALPESAAYIPNMRLSQERTRAILEFVLQLPQAAGYSDWAKPHITANGLSSSHLLNNDGKLIAVDGGKENKELSRRVEFRLLTSSCQRAGIDHRKEKEAANEN